MYKTSATSGERSLILEKLRQGMSAPAIAHELGFTIEVVCEIRNEALKNSEPFCAALAQVIRKEVIVCRKSTTKER